jgi:hypothetical protein
MSIAQTAKVRAAPATASRNQWVPVATTITVTPTG